MNSFSEQLRTHLAAGAPAFYVQTREEARLDRLLRAECGARRTFTRVIEWNPGLGLVGFEDKQPTGQESKRPVLFDDLAGLNEEDLEGQLIVVKGVRLAVELDRQAVGALRQLINRINRSYAGNAALMLVSEAFDLPAELESVIKCLDLPLLTLDEIGERIDAFAKKVRIAMPPGLRQRAATTLSGLGEHEIERVLALACGSQSVLDDGALERMLREKEQRIAQSGVLEMVRSDESFDRIGGLEQLKNWLQRKAQVLARWPEAQARRMQAPRGCLIAGMPGCGKSLSAKAAAAAFHQPLLRLDIGALLGKYVGESEHNLRHALALAESMSPCVLWVDELEKAFVGLDRGTSEVSARLLGNFLTWLQEKRKPVFVIATANDITVLPPELLRKGRFDEVFYVAFPSAREREQILSVQLQRLDLEPKRFELARMARRTRDFTGADLESAINVAIERAFIGDRPLAQDDLWRAIEETVPLRDTLRDQIGKYEELFEKLKLTPASSDSAFSAAKMRRITDEDNPAAKETVARHPDCPDDILARLADESDARVRNAALANSNCPGNALAKILVMDRTDRRYSEESFTLAWQHPNAPSDLLIRLYKEEMLSGKQMKFVLQREDVRKRAIEDGLAPRLGISG
ncbi:AAA family ATPase [Burkholderia cepacia]|uniref:AAA family ATPase n=1 Tax=Burkholderia cepacia TaxID=292 RepID=UPI0009BD8461|nr:AAA family ATPase [Burkholderia cepacia]